MGTITREIKSAAIFTEDGEKFIGLPISEPSIVETEEMDGFHTSKTFRSVKDIAGDFTFKGSYINHDFLNGILNSDTETNTVSISYDVRCAAQKRANKKKRINKKWLKKYGVEFYSIRCSGNINMYGVDQLSGIIEVNVVHDPETVSKLTEHYKNILLYEYYYKFKLKDMVWNFEGQQTE